jgi:hypothetical protein
MTLGSVVWDQVAGLYSIRVSLLVSAAGTLLAVPLVWQARLGQGMALTELSHVRRRGGAFA